MGMEFWLIPVVAMVVAGVTIFYLVIRNQGGSGARGDGQTVVDKRRASKIRRRVGTITSRSQEQSVIHGDANKSPPGFGMRWPLRRFRMTNAPGNLTPF